MGSDSAAKAAAPDLVAAAVEALRPRLKPPTRLQKLLRGLYGDAALQATRAASEQLGTEIGGTFASLTQELPDDYWSNWTPGWGDAASQLAGGGLRDMLDQAGVTISSIVDSRLNDLGDLIAAGVAAGASVDSIASDAQDLLSDPSRAFMIANTETARAMTTQSLSDYQQAGVGQVDWLAEGDACPDCQENEDASPINLGDDWPNGDPPVHPNCFPGETSVVAAGVLGSTARWWDGELVEIVTDAGRHLTVTPNHPILTPKGWVAAGALVEGSDVISSSRPERVAALVCPDDYHAPALIEEIAVALSGTGSVTTATVPVAAEDFHGDGTGSQVSVIRADRLLEDGWDVTLAEPLGEQHLARRGSEKTSFTRSSALDLFGKRMGAPPGGGVGRGGVGTTLLRGTTGGLQAVSGGHIADRDPLVAKGSGKGPAAHSKLPSELLYRLPGDVIVDPVVAVRRLPFSGHVYNLQTVCGWYIASGIVVHNCRCALAPVVDDSDDSDGEGEF